MGKTLRTNSDNKDFRVLIKKLDKDLNRINGNSQSDYDKYNTIDFLDTVVIYYIDKQAVGCGAYIELKKDTVEIKRVFISNEFRGRGLSKIIISELEKWAKEKGYFNVVLETGIKQEAALSLYEKSGYKKIDNYGPYKDLLNSVCMAKIL